ncbi:LysR family transcriptional regulator [Mycolicibacterium sediminis]|uniref:LysR family transcriptional regulator n=1 Tax=Mycolicibacterium sediminis TaxID=1286180 RepID=A0A7I7QUK6_9MYCO|nr:LysR family transcriptional regulator [Mycolicibacterium sediminis]BBY30004.1 LysR family transcriptional regulator [Mycolicibacterium sediminis]
MRPDLIRLHILAAVERHGSMAGAASELRYTPSAVSQQIRKLEMELHATLVDRHPKGVRLTAAGHLVVRRVQAIDHQLDALSADLEELQRGYTGTVRFGVFPTFAAALLPDVVIGLRTAYPRIRLAVHSSRISPLRELLDEHQLDLALTWDYPWNQTPDADVVRRELLFDPTVLIVAADHPLARVDHIDLADVAAEEWIVRAGGHPTAELLFRCAHAAGFAPKIAIEVSDYQETQAMVAAGLGITLCPRLAAHQLRGDVVVKRLAGPIPTRRICSARIRDAEFTTAAQRLEGILQTVVDDYSAI